MHHARTATRPRSVECASPTPNLFFFRFLGGPGSAVSFQGTGVVPGDAQTPSNKAMGGGQGGRRPVKNTHTQAPSHTALCPRVRTKWKTTWCQPQLASHPHNGQGTMTLSGRGKVPRYFEAISSSQLVKQPRYIDLRKHKTMLRDGLKV